MAGILRRGVYEEMPHNMPEPLGTPVSTIMFMVDYDHASNVVTQRSLLEYLWITFSILLQSSHSKKQNTVEESMYGDELVALRICCDIVVATRLKLKSIGVPLDGPTTILCDNNGVKNQAFPHPHWLRIRSTIRSIITLSAKQQQLESCE